MIFQIYQVSIMNIIDTYEECFNPFQLPHLFLKHSVIPAPFYQELAI